MAGMVVVLNAYLYLQVKKQPIFLEQFRISFIQWSYIKDPFLVEAYGRTVAELLSTKMLAPTVFPFLGLLIEARILVSMANPNPDDFKNY